MGIKVLIAGSAGFIGLALVRHLALDQGIHVVNVDKLTYAGNLENLASLQGDLRHVFVQGDIGDSALVASLLAEHRPRAVLQRPRAELAFGRHVAQRDQLAQPRAPLLLRQVLACSVSVTSLQTG